MTDEANAAGAATTNAASAAGKTFTQDEVDRMIGDRLARERGKYSDYDEAKTKAAEYDKLAETRKTELERAIGERDTFKTTAEQVAAENLRLKVAVKKQIPPELIDRLQGSNEKELEADADQLLTIVSPNARSFDGGARGTTAPQDMDSLIRQSAGYAP